MQHSVPISAAATKVQITRWGAGRAEKRSDLVAAEEPLEIRVRGRSVAVTMRTPGHDRELAVGFLVTEGIIRSPGDVVEIAPCRESETPENTLNVFLAPSVTVDFDQLTRHVFASSSCGLCGKASIESVHQALPPLKSDFRVAPETLLSLPEKMRAAQATFSQTGGLHAAGLFGAHAEMLCLYEDVGRHNAVDKILGHAVLNGWLPLERHVLLVSGRASFEIVQKALAGRIPVIAAISAPSSLAVEFAKESGQTLVGFLREDAMNVYSGLALAL
jgi:FdhD protein